MRQSTFNSEKSAISTKELKELLSKSTVEVDFQTTGFEVEEDELYLYAYINNDVLCVREKRPLQDVGFMINGKREYLSEEQEEIVRLFLIDKMEDFFTEQEEECENEDTEDYRQERNHEYFYTHLKA